MQFSTKSDQGPAVKCLIPGLGRVIRGEPGACTYARRKCSKSDGGGRQEPLRKSGAMPETLD